MKIHQSRRNSCVPKSLLHMKDVLTVFQQMCGRAVPECMYGNDGVKTCLSQCVLKYCTYISRIDALRCDSPSMGLKDKVVTGVPLPECPQHNEHLRGDGYISVLIALTLADEEHLSVKTDIFPSEPAHFTNSECAVVGKRQQGLVIQSAALDKPCYTSLGEYSGEFLLLSDFWEHQSSGLFKSHDLVVVLQPKDRVLKKGDAVPF